MGGGSTGDSGGMGSGSMGSCLLGFNSDNKKLINEIQDSGESSTADSPESVVAWLRKSLCLRLCLSPSQMHREAERKGFDIRQKVAQLGHCGSCF